MRISYLSKARQSAEVNVAASLEELSTLRAKMEELEEELCNQVALLKEELLTERSRFEKNEGTLAVQLEGAQRQIGGCVEREGS